MQSSPATFGRSITTPTDVGGQKAERLRDLSPQQWKSGIAAWLGWFDGFLFFRAAAVAIVLPEMPDGGTVT